MPRLEERCWSCSCSPSVKSQELSSAGWIVCKTGEMMSIITSVLRHACGSVHSLHSANLIRRGLVLFIVGVVLALVLNLLQVQRNVTLFPEEVLDTLFSSAWWIPLCCGTAAGKSLFCLYRLDKNIMLAEGLLLSYLHYVRVLILIIWGQFCWHWALSLSVSAALETAGHLGSVFGVLLFHWLRSERVSCEEARYWLEGRTCHLAEKRNTEVVCSRN